MAFWQHTASWPDFAALTSLQKEERPIRSFLAGEFFPFTPNVCYRIKNSGSAGAGSQP